ncbi:iron dependent repressor, metal binding and dimerization domain protein [Clostridium lundense]|uniref:iron dependent repressor, metal binding and dimerization domain protein n=1 Tax=Clostridium lundense TaxID=319475 RepID=UPI000482BB43|nr:iron dependent repressor, metal binding and dimerization domain protein [Clostridium lundense]
MSKGDFYTVRGYEILEKEKNVLTHSMEDYLEMIYRKSLEEGYTRINVLAESLNVQPPSATKMVQKLTKLEFVNYEKYGIIQLTQKGEAMGEFLLNRHEIIEDFFKTIGVKEEILVNIELMEHNITNDALNKIERLNYFFKDNYDVKKRFLEYTKNK